MVAGASVPTAPNDYDSFAEAYAAANESSLLNGYYARPAVLELARQRLGEGAVLHQAALGGDPLPFPDGAFDDAIVCLVLHYLEDWTAPLAELRRVLAPGGRLIWSSTTPSTTSCSIAMPTTSRSASTPRRTP